MANELAINVRLYDNEEVISKILLCANSMLIIVDGPIQVDEKK